MEGYACSLAKRLGFLEVDVVVCAQTDTIVPHAEVVAISNRVCGEGRFVQNSLTLFWTVGGKLSKLLLYTV